MISKLLQRVGGLSEAAAGLLIELVGRYRKYLIVALVASFTSALMEGGTLALLALALKALGGEALDGFPRAVGEVFGLDRDGLFVLFVLAAIASQVMFSVLDFVSDAAAGTLQARVEETARLRIFDRFMSLSYAEARRYKVGELSSHMDQVNFLGLALQRLHIIVSQLLLLGVYFGLLLWFSWEATLLSAVVMAAVTLLIRKLIRRVHVAANQFKRSLVTVSEQTIELLNGLRVIQTFAREDYARDRVGVAIHECARTRRRGLMWQATIAPAIQIVSVCVVGGVLVVGFLVYGASDRGKLIELAGFLLVLFRLAPRLSTLNKSWGLLAHYLPFFERASEILDDTGRLPRAGGARRFAGLRERIEFANVTLTYPGTDSPAVRDLSFTLPRGKMIALVGESGAGKTTIADLLLGLYPVTSGAILIDGVPLGELDWDDWRRHVGVVSQDKFLLNGTIRDNIALGKLDATDAEIEAAARAAHAHDFITQFEAGYQTMLGEQGYRLSGGQRQRIAIARAILRDPQILILDEATSDLDSQSEALIQESMVRLSANRTVLVIAHRLSTIAAADEILVLREGRIAERGRHADLLSSGGAYATFVNLQVNPRVHATPPSE